MPGLLLFNRDLGTPKWRLYTYSSCRRPTIQVFTRPALFVASDGNAGSPIPPTRLLGSPGTNTGEGPVAPPKIRATGSRTPVFGLKARCPDRWTMAPCEVEVGSAGVEPATVALRGRDSAS